MISGGGRRRQEAIHAAPALLMCDGDRTLGAHSTILLMPRISQRTKHFPRELLLPVATRGWWKCAGAGGGEVPRAVTMNGPPATCNVR